MTNANLVEIFWNPAAWDDNGAWTFWAYEDGEPLGEGSLDVSIAEHDVEGALAEARELFPSAKVVHEED